MLKPNVLEIPRRVRKWKRKYLAVLFGQRAEAEAAFTGTDARRPSAPVASFGFVSLAHNGDIFNV